MPLIQMFDKQINLRMGQANVKRWIDDILPLVSGDDDPLGVDTYATHRVPLDDAPQAYETFQRSRTAASRCCCSREGRRHGSDRERRHERGRRAGGRRPGDRDRRHRAPPARLGAPAHALGVGQLRASGAMGGGRPIDFGDDPRLEGEQLHGGFRAPRLGFGNGTFIAIEDGQFERELEVPFVLPLVPLVTTAEVQVGILAGDLDAQVRLARFVGCQRGKDVRTMLQRALPCFFRSEVRGGVGGKRVLD